jgi:hypothetical protein
MYGIRDMLRDMNWPARVATLFVLIVGGVFVLVLAYALLTTPWLWDWDTQASPWFSECPRCD